jgi:peptide/nickel transport system permease protein
MGGFLLRKVGAALIVLLLASLLVFLGVRALPGDQALALGGENRDPQVLQELRHDYGLDRPLPVQYVYLARSTSLRGDLGTDQRKLRVGHTIVTRLPITLELARLSVLLRLLIGILAGVIAAVGAGRRPITPRRRPPSWACRCRTSGSGCS